MMVKELIAELKKMPQDLDVVDVDEYDILSVCLVDENRESRLRPIGGTGGTVHCNWVVLG